MSIGGFGELLSGIAAILKVASDKDTQGNAKQLLQFVHGRPELTYKDDNATITSKALHRMQQGTAPRIAVVGMTSAGKSLLVNKLFGSPLAEVKITPDTTNSILRVEFPSGLVVYDTPGIFGDEKLPYENITRLFLGLPQDSLLPKVQYVPYRADALANITNLSSEEIREKAPIDTVLWVVNINNTPTRLTKPYFESFYLQLENHYSGHVMVAGTHLDLLTSVSPEEKKQMLELWEEVSGGNLLPVSSTLGEGLDELVLALFRTLADQTSLSKLQESLLAERKLNRLSFVITEASALLSSMVILDGKKEEEIRIASVTLFAIICNHYAVDEPTWLKYHGNALEIGAQAKNVGKEVVKITRTPKGFWERVRSVFGAKFFDKETKYYALGIRGLKIMLPSIYQTLYGFEKPDISPTSDQEVIHTVESARSRLNSLVNRKDEVQLATEISALLMILFDNKRRKNV